MNLFIYIFTIISLYACGDSGNRTNFSNNDVNKKVIAGDTIKTNIPAGLQKLLKAYPDFLEKADENNLYWKDGTVMVWDDGIQNKSHDEMLDSPDLEDMMSQQYVKGANWDEPPAENFEPGRIRYEPFFTKMYGSSSGEVQRNLVNVS